jgi:hypothetical protein
MRGGTRLSGEPGSFGPYAIPSWSPPTKSQTSMFVPVVATDMADMSQQTCLEDERAARADLMKEWGQFSAQDKAICTDQSTNYHPSYVELLTCLEIARDAKSYTTRDGEVTNPAPKAGAGFAPD